MPYKRNIDKRIYDINETIDTTTQTEIALQNISTTGRPPCTIKGVRWQLTRVPGSSGATVRWAIVVKRQGVTLPAIGASTSHATPATEFFSNEADVLAWGVLDARAESVYGGMNVHEGAIKTARKMRSDDTLMFIWKSDVTNGGYIRGAIQYFCML